MFPSPAVHDTSLALRPFVRPSLSFFVPRPLSLSESIAVYCIACCTALCDVQGLIQKNFQGPIAPRVLAWVCVYFGRIFLQF